ncbi:hypothetical protein PISMIDRAFT_682374, partial [Pisolithus microcarpus 441]
MDRLYGKVHWYYRKSHNNEAASRLSSMCTPRRVQFSGGTIKIKPPVQPTICLSTA